MKVDKLYRYEPQYYPNNDCMEINLLEFEIIKNTRGGFWINVFGVKKWVSNYSKKRYAYPDKISAKINLLKRTKRRLLILNSQIEICNLVLNLIDK